MARAVVWDEDGPYRFICFARHDVGGERLLVYSDEGGWSGQFATPWTEYYQFYGQNETGNRFRFEYIRRESYTHDKGEILRKRGRSAPGRVAA